MVSFTVKVILHVSKKDSKYRDVAPFRHKGKENKVIENKFDLRGTFQFDGEF